MNSMDELFGTHKMASCGDVFAGVAGERQVRAAAASMFFMVSMSLRGPSSRRSSHTVGIRGPPPVAAWPAPPGWVGLTVIIAGQVAGRPRVTSRPLREEVQQARPVIEAR